MYHQASQHDTSGKSRVFVVVPAYNEEQKIGIVVMALLAKVSCVIVVDDGFTDTTAQCNAYLESTHA